MENLKRKDEIKRKLERKKVQRDPVFDALSREKREEVRQKKYQIPPIGLYTPKYEYVSPQRPHAKLTGRSPIKVEVLGNSLDLSPQKP